MWEEIAVRTASYLSIRLGKWGEGELVDELTCAVLRRLASSQWLIPGDRTLALCAAITVAEGLLRERGLP